MNWRDILHLVRLDRRRWVEPDAYRPDNAPTDLRGRLKRLVRRLSGARFTGLSTMQGTVTTTFRWLAGQNLTGAVYNQTQNQGTITKTYSLAQSTANNTSAGADEVFSFQQAICTSSTATVDMTAMTNLLQQAAVAIVRNKSWQIRLLSATDDATISPAPNTSSTITVTNNVTLPARLNLGSAGSGLLLNITNAASGVINSVAINAAGSGYPINSTFPVTVNQINGAGAVISINPNTTGVPTAAVIANGGTGYLLTSGLPTTELGSFTLQTGNAQMIVDVSAAGSALSATSKNIKILNNDPANIVTFELDVIGGTT